MGVPVGEAEGEHIALLQCTSCDEQYETDETTMNDCPHCHSHLTYEMVDGGDPENWR